MPLTQGDAKLLAEMVGLLFDGEGLEKIRYALSIVKKEDSVLSKELTKVLEQSQANRKEEAFF